MKVRQRSNADKGKKSNTHETALGLYEGQELTFNTFKSKIFPLKLTRGKGRPLDYVQLKLMTRNQMLWKLQ